MAASSSSSSSFIDDDDVKKFITKRHHVEQRTRAWYTLRAGRIGGSDGASIGLCRFKSPYQFYLEKTGRIKRTYETNPSMEHGNRFESSSDGIFRKWFAVQCQRRLEDTTEQIEEHEEQTEIFNTIFPSGYYPSTQDYDIPGYHTPLLRHPWFHGENDRNLFGVSLDVEGSIVDCEIKNPATYLNFYKYYLSSIKPTIFFQIQWGMAMRDRQHMFLLVTSYDSDTSILLGLVIWLVTFDSDYFRTFIYPRAQLMQSFLKRDTLVEESEFSERLPWINDADKYETSEEYKTLHNKTCKRIHVWKNGKVLSEIINKK